MYFYFGIGVKQTLVNKPISFANMGDIDLMLKKVFCVALWIHNNLLCISYDDIAHKKKQEKIKYYC